MFDFYYAVTHHMELIQIAKAERMARSARSHLPGLKDRVYLRLGDFLINMGGRLRKASVLDCEIPVGREASVPGLMQDYS